MFGLPNPYILIGAGVLFLVSNALSGWAGHTVTHNAWEAAQAEMLEQQASQRVADETRLNDLSAQLETAKAKRDVVTRTITKVVNKVVERPVYRSCQLDDDGLRLARAALSNASPDPGGPDGKLPAAGPAGRPVDGSPPAKARGG